MAILDKAYINVLLADMSYIDFKKSEVTEQSTGHPKV